MKDYHKYLVCVAVVTIALEEIYHQILQCFCVKLVLCVLKAALDHFHVAVECLPTKQVDHLVNNALQDSTVYLWIPITLP